MKERTFFAFILLLSQLSQLTQSAIANCAVENTLSQTCVTCDPGYESLDNGTSCSQIDCGAMPSCDLCDSSSTCLACSLGYVVNSDRSLCVRIICLDPTCSLCASSETNECLVCQLTSFLGLDGLCSLCRDAISDCSICIPSISGPTCTTCDQGFYPDSNGKCSECGAGEPNCQDCTSLPEGNMLCFNCTDTYYISDAFTGTCSSCSDSIPNCSLCSENPSKPQNVSCYQCNNNTYASMAQT